MYIYEYLCKVLLHSSLVRFKALNLLVLTSWLLPFFTSWLLEFFTSWLLEVQDFEQWQKGAVSYCNYLTTSTISPQLCWSSAPNRATFSTQMWVNFHQIGTLSKLKCGLTFTKLGHFLNSNVGQLSPYQATFKLKCGSTFTKLGHFLNSNVGQLSPNLDTF